MAESKFLPLQDANGDGLNDVCDVVITPPVKECPECIPNSTAIVPNWRQRKLFEPFLNEKNCKYQITVTTRYTSTLVNLSDRDPETLTDEEAEAAIDDIYEEYKQAAIEGLLDSYNKDDSAGSQTLIRDVIESTDWALGLRRLARLKLLYSVPYEVLNAIPDAEGDEDEEETEGIEVSYDVEEMSILMIQLRKGLWLYGRNLKVYRNLPNYTQGLSSDPGNILFLSDNSKFNLEDYGDYGFKKQSSQMGKMIPALDKFLNKKGFNLTTAGGFMSELGNRNRAVSRLTFTFSNTYELQKLEIEAAGCKEKPIEMTGKLMSLKVSGSPWIDATAAAYFAQMRDMVDDLSARTPTPWKDFIINYTYPQVYDTANSVYDNSDSVIGCIGEALANEAKELGADILDEVFGLGDAIAYQFHELLCENRLDDTNDMLKDLGLYLDKDGKIRYENIQSLAKQQAFEEMDANELMFANFCKWMFSSEEERPGTEFAESVDLMKDMWDNLDRLKLCGLLDLMTEAIQCLLGGLTLEAGLGKMLEAALKAMSIDNFGQLFIGLDADKQAELDALVKEKIESGDIFKDESENQDATDDIAGNYTDEGDRTGEEGKWQLTKPWNRPAAEKDKHDWVSSTEGSYSNMSYGQWENYQENFVENSVLPKAYAGASATAGRNGP